MNIAGTDDIKDRLNELRAFKEELENAESVLSELKDEWADYKENHRNDEEEIDEVELEELEDRIDKATDAVQEAQSNFDEEEQEELKELENIESEVPDFNYGTTLISVNFFERYAQQLCEDIGDIPKDLPSYIVIDWEKTAENLKADYSEIDYRGNTYYYRNS